MKRKIFIITILLLSSLSLGRERDLKIGPATGPASPGKPELVIQNGHSDRVTSVSFSPDGKTLASGSRDNTIKLWSVPEGKLLNTLAGHSDEVLSVSISPNGKTLASGSVDKTIKLWSVADGKLLHTLEGHSNYVSSVSFSPDGKTLASGGCDDKGESINCIKSTIKLWSVPEGELLRTLKGHSWSVSSVSFSPDGKTLASGSLDKTIKLWSVLDGKLLSTLEGHSDYVYSVSFSPDGKTLASGSWDKTIRLWSVPEGKLLHTLEGHSVGVDTVFFSPDGKTLASGSADNTIKLWSVPEGRLLHTLKGHSNFVSSVSFSPDGKTLVSGSYDTTIRFWEVSSGRLLCTLLPLDKEDWVVFTPEGYFDTSENGKNYIGWTVGMKNYGFEQFWDGYYRPGLFSRVISGEKIEGGKDLSQGFAPPPEVVILSPKAGEIITGEVAQVKVRVTDTGGGIQFIRLYHQGKLSGFTEILSGSKPIETITYPAPLVEGENVLRATAYSRDNIEAVPFEVKIRSAVAAKKPNLFILAVGINKYRYPGINLSYSRADAEGMLEFYRKQEGRIFERVYATALFDEEATRAKILDALKQPARPEDVAIIYLAGHGEAFSGKYYFLPYDLADITDEAIMKSGVSQEEIISAVRACPATKVLLILDSCKSGTLAVTMRGLEEKRAVMLLSKTAGVHVLAATAEEQSAAELAQFGHGLFTYEILDGLSGKADENGDRIVQVFELLPFVSDQVMRQSEARSRPQSPTVMMQGGNFPVAVY
jgi:WD40 repeat protein